MLRKAQAPFEGQLGSKRGTQALDQSLWCCTTSHDHEFDARECGSFPISLTYDTQAGPRLARRRPHRYASQ